MSEAGNLTVDQVKNFIKNISLMDAAKLVKDLEEELGVSAAAPVMMGAAMMAGGGQAAGGEAEEKDEFTMVLDNAGAEKVKVIKVVRELTGLGLKEAKDLVDAAPKTLKEGVAKKDAEEFKKKFEEAGAKVSLK